MIKNLRAIPVDLLYNVIRLDLTNFRSGIRNLKKNPIEWKGGVEMKLLESGEDYLEAILVLQKQEEKVRSIDIANALKVSKASVCVAMKNLKKGGSIHMGEDHVITLTEEGKRLAEFVYERHVLFSEVLANLGVDQETARKDACRMEHVLSEDSFQVLKHYFDQNGISSEHRE